MSNFRFLIKTIFSSGPGSDHPLITTDTNKKCTSDHSGTSASAPIAAAVIALVLEANSELTWRDIQHIIVKTAQARHLEDRDWKFNGMRRKVSHNYGYGLMDAGLFLSITFIHVIS